MSSSDICYRCGGRGHFARHCQNGMSARPVGNAGFTGGPQKCYKCSRAGHFARECPQDQERCYKCNEFGHIAKDCEKPITAGACYNCGSSDHLQRDCPQAIVKSCYTCGQSGHLAKECSIPANNQGGGFMEDLRKCYACGGVGHFAKECPSARKQCYRVGGFGPMRGPPSRISRTIVRSGGPYRWAADNHRKEVKWN